MTPNVYILTWMNKPYNKKQVITGKSLMEALKRNGYKNCLPALLHSKTVISEKDKVINPNKASLLYTE